jgi:hypothetical protein
MIKQFYRDKPVKKQKYETNKTNKNPNPSSNSNHCLCDHSDSSRVV